MDKDIFLLDMDDTLFDFKQCERVNLFSSLAKFGIAADEQVLQRFHKINKSLWERLERGEMTREEVKIGRFEMLLNEYGYTADFKAVAAEYFANFQNICIPFEGAKEFLLTLKSHGRVYFVTNGDTAIQKRHMADAGFDKIIDGAFISHEIGFDKPSKKYADYVKAHIPNFEEGRAIWIGDSLSSDCECARVANIDFILFAPDGAPENYSGTTVKNYGEILEILHIN